ncbi:hypothetical protein [Bradyrhizobium sp. 131]|uniref:hypothetical protein n=1 Tax=Bradyrhizobium sp. 131 TaxID=2782609 RepID=UPI001FFE3411|nr:hypothetical protein [Bradyrhizobium sp. 131]UPK23339.1 hypothetical protein IVA73_37590 [Bradyrhizobium sp. 131]
MIVKLGKLLVLAQCRQHARAAIGRNELEQGRPRLEGKDARCGSTGMLVNVGFLFAQCGGEALRDRLEKPGRFGRCPRRDQKPVPLKVIGLDTWIERRAHEPAAARLVEPDVLVAGEGRSEIELRDGIEPGRLQKRPGPAVAGFHHQFDQRAHVRRGITNLRRPVEPATRMGPDKIVDNLECQICPRQRLIRKIHVWLKLGLKNPAAGRAL